MRGDRNVAFVNKVAERRKKHFKKTCVNYGTCVKSNSDQQFEPEIERNYERKQN